MFQKLSTVTILARIIWLTHFICICVHGQQSDGSVTLNQGVVLGVHFEFQLRAIWISLSFPISFLIWFANSWKSSQNHRGWQSIHIWAFHMHRLPLVIYVLLWVDLFAIRCSSERDICLGFYSLVLFNSFDFLLWLLPLRYELLLCTTFSHRRSMSAGEIEHGWHVIINQSVRNCKIMCSMNHITATVDETQRTTKTVYL